MADPKDKSEDPTHHLAGGATNPYFDDDPSPTMPGDLEAGASGAPTARDGDPGTLEDRIRAKMNESARVRHDPILGQVFGGRFEITGKIGAGGMGVVYKARQKGMDRSVAVKVLVKQAMTNDVAIKRFQREALAVSKLEHPNTVRIYDFGETPDGTPYLAMEFLTGAPLERIMRHERQLPVRRVLRIIQQICRSLDEAHQKGIVHRDLKPDNVFVGAIEGQPDYVKVLDFGVAKLREGDTEGGTLTQHGTIFGTPKYMSPEQCRSQEVDARSDLYSVGIMMHEMLSGRVPFESDNPLSILIMHAQDTVQALAESRPDLVVPFEVEELMHRLLSKEAEDRPQTAKDVIDRCEALLHSIPDDFESVLTYEAAQQAGKLFDRSSAFTVPDANTRSNLLADRTRRMPDEGDSATLAGHHLPAIPTPLWKKALWGVAILALVAGAAGAWLWSRIQGLPPESTQLMPAQWASAALPAIEAPLVTVTARANVGGVTVVDAKTGELRGQIEAANTATVLGKWLKEPGRKVSLRFQRVNAAPVEMEVDLGQDVTLPLVTFAIDEANEVTLSVKANVDGVDVSLVGSDQFYRTREVGSAVKIPLAIADKAITLTFEKTGYKKHTATFVPTADGALDVALEKEPEVVVAPVPVPPNPNNTVHVVRPPRPQRPPRPPVDTIKLQPLKDPSPPKNDKLDKVGGVKSF